MGSINASKPANDIIYFSKEGPATHLGPLQPGQFDQSYVSLKTTAFHQYHMGIAGALEPLYNFWAGFLAGNFNANMYQEFKTTAMNDLRQGNSNGLAYLVRYFNKILSAPLPLSERLASDMVELAREESVASRTIFQALRAAWRNGATNMKTIKRLGDALTAEEKAELDKSG
jgi:hypothetical protein